MLRITVPLSILFFSLALMVPSASAVLIADPVRQTMLQAVQVPDDPTISMICLEFSDGGELCQTASAGAVLEFEFEVSGCGNTWNAFAYNTAGLKSPPSDTGINFTIDADCDGHVPSNADLFCIFKMLFKDDLSCVQ